MIRTWPNRLFRTGSGQLDIDWPNLANNVKLCEKILKNAQWIKKQIKILYRSY